MGEVLLGLGAVLGSVAAILSAWFSRKTHNEVKTVNGKTTGTYVTETIPHDLAAVKAQLELNTAMTEATAGVITKHVVNPNAHKAGVPE